MNSRCAYLFLQEKSTLRELIHYDDTKQVFLSNHMHVRKWEYLRIGISLKSSRDFVTFKDSCIWEGDGTHGHYRFSRQIKYSFTYYTKSPSQIDSYIQRNKIIFENARCCFTFAPVMSHCARNSQSPLMYCPVLVNCSGNR